jgi:4-hydroxybenzoate polyprenyltransferase
MRPYLLFVSGVTGVVGLSLAPGVPTSDAIALGLVFFVSYGFGQALTDCFQLDTDTLSAPYRPLVVGTLRRRDVLLLSVAALLACGAVVLSYHRVNAALAPLAVLGLATYTWFKRRWWGGPPWNAGIVVVLLLIGYVSGAGAANTRLAWTTGTLGALVVTFFGYANFVLTGYLKDLSADRATGYRTFPVVFGWRATTVVSHGFALVALLGVLVAVTAVEAIPTLGPWLGFVAAGIVATVVGQARLARVHEEAGAHRAIVAVVHAYVLLLSGIAALHRPGWALALVVSYLAFTLLMQRRPALSQV